MITGLGTEGLSLVNIQSLLLLNICLLLLSIDVYPEGGSAVKGKGLKEGIIPSEGVLHSRNTRNFFLHGGWGQVFNTKVNFPMLYR